MIARMNNIYKVEKAKEKSQKSKRLKSVAAMQAQEQSIFKSTFYVHYIY